MELLSHCCVDLMWSRYALSGCLATWLSSVEMKGIAGSPSFKFIVLRKMDQVWQTCFLNFWKAYVLVWLKFRRTFSKCCNSQQDMINGLTLNNSQPLIEPPIHFKLIKLGIPSYICLFYMCADITSSNKITNESTRKWRVSTTRWWVNGQEFIGRT